MPWNEKKDKSKRLHKVGPIKEKQTLSFTKRTQL